MLVSDNGEDFTELIGRGAALDVKISVDKANIRPDTMDTLARMVAKLFIR
jgi:hypothetical protein